MLSFCPFVTMLLTFPILSSFFCYIYICIGTYERLTDSGTLEARASSDTGNDDTVLCRPLRYGYLQVDVYIYKPVPP